MADTVTVYVVAMTPEIHIIKGVVDAAEYATSRYLHVLVGGKHIQPCTKDTNCFASYDEARDRALYLFDVAIQDYMGYKDGFLKQAEDLKQRIADMDVRIDDLCKRKARYADGSCDA